MHAGARTPEELDSLLEDAFVMHDSAAVRELFEHRAVLACDAFAVEARGRSQIASCASALWSGGTSYISGHLRVVQARDAALLLGACGVSVARRCPDRAWRYAIALIEQHQSKEDI